MIQYKLRAYPAKRNFFSHDLEAKGSVITVTVYSETFEDACEQATNGLNKLGHNWVWEFIIDSLEFSDSGL